MYGYSFPFDFDRRHTVSVVANVQLSRRLRASATALYASGFPVTPMHDDVVFAQIQRPDGTFDPIARAIRNQDGTFFMGPSATRRRLSLRNSERLSGYSRVDVRLTYATLGRWEIYGEVINLFGTRNYLQTIVGPALGADEERPIHANNIYEQFERFPSFGVRIRF